VNPISLSVGPSQISEAVANDIREIGASGLLAESHRGPVVQGLLRGTVAAVRAAMHLPDDYEFLFQPSATAAMEMTLRNCVRASSFHFVHGAFSARFANTADQIGLQATRFESGWDAPLAPEGAQVPEDTEMICVTHAETSTGRMWPHEELAALRARHPEPLLAVDVTSSFGAMAMDWTAADVWLGSVQKVWGLPAGLGYVVVGPRAFERAEALGSERTAVSWQDLLVLRKRSASGETVETPNIFDIALLERQAGRWDLAQVEAETRAKAALMAEVFEDERFYQPDPRWRSLTVHCMKADDPEAWRRRAVAAGAVIGAGYGPLKQSCVRIATFPAVSFEDTERVLRAVAG